MRTDSNHESKELGMGKSITSHTIRECDN